MDLKYLTTFKTIVEEGSFTAAAEKLHYTQSTITFQMDQLEQELSVSLFEKIGRKMVLTAAGRELIPHVDEVFQAVDKLYYLGKDLSDCEGELHIGVAETYLCYRLPQALKAFVSRAPRARLYIQSMNCYEIRNQLMDGTLDAGIFYQNVGGYGDRLSIYPLESFPAVLVASPAIAQNFSDFVTPGQHYSIPLIINEPNCIFRQIFESYLKSQSIILDHTIELASIPTIKNLVQNDVGVSFLPRFTVEEELAAGSLVEVATNVEPNELTIVYAHHKNKWISPLQQLFMECISAHRGLS
ncbi:MAG: LysR family transcriptional regulator [Lachnospiraceae bacterium]|nr:LysR family transcriptional regulator [Lachnospiraceae bacterium]